MATSTIERGNSFQDSLAIVADSDLNDFSTPGAYYVSSSSTAATIAHTPVTASGFALLVLRQSNLCHQMVIAGGRFFTRYLGSSGWGNWYKYTGEVN